MEEEDKRAFLLAKSTNPGMKPQRSESDPTITPGAVGTHAEAEKRWPGASACAAGGGSPTEINAVQVAENREREWRGRIERQQHVH